jgi:hypothetical protein
MSAVPDLATYLTDASLPDGAPDTEAPEEERQRYRLGGDREASWALMKLAKAEAEKGRIRTLAEDERSRIDQWEAEASAGPRRDADYFRSLLFEYHVGLLKEEVAALEAEGKTPAEAWAKARRKTYRLPAGTLTARKGGEGVEVEDAAAFEAWVRKNPEANVVLAAVKPDKVTVKQQTEHTPDGTIVIDGDEVVPGLRWYADPPSFTATPAPLPGEGRP